MSNDYKALSILRYNHVSSVVNHAAEVPILPQLLGIKAPVQPHKHSVNCVWLTAAASTVWMPACTQEEAFESRHATFYKRAHSMAWIYQMYLFVWGGIIGWSLQTKKNQWGTEEGSWNILFLSLPWAFIPLNKQRTKDPPIYAYGFKHCWQGKVWSCHLRVNSDLLKWDT